MVLFFVFTVAEPIRLWIGYGGNLKEHFERMCIFLILTCFQGGMFAYFIPFQPKLMPIDIIVGIIEAVFFLFEFICTIFAIRHFIRISSMKSTGQFDSSGVMYIETNIEENQVQEFEDIELEQES